MKISDKAEFEKANVFGTGEGLYQEEGKACK